MGRSKRNPWDTFFLIVAAVGFFFFLFQPWWSHQGVRYFQAFFEASLVGALADWFAVTALFRRPLGLPLPHTDLLVRRKDQLVQALPRFLGSFLTPEKLNPVLQEVDWARLAVEHVDPAVLDRLAAEATTGLENLPQRDAWEQKAVDFMVDLVHRELSRHREALVGPITEIIKRHVGWKRVFVQRQTIDEAIEGFLDELAEVRDRPDHELRQTLIVAFRNAWPRMVRHFKPSQWTAETWTRLKNDPPYAQAFNKKTGELAVALWEKAGLSTALTAALEYVLGQTDARNLADQIESAVRNDLQYIRVNGALVGGLAGLLLEFLKPAG